jgi:hypothetical protein
MDPFALVGGTVVNGAGSLPKSTLIVATALR